MFPPVEDEINESMGLQTAVKGRSRDAIDLFPSAGSLLQQTRRDFYMTFLLSPVLFRLSDSTVFVTVFQRSQSATQRE